MNITAPQSGNITKLYRETYSKEEKVESNSVDNSIPQKLKFDTWRTYPVTQEFIKALEEERNRLLIRAMANSGVPALPFLITKAELLTRILSETIFTGELL